jgi:hypothetical protein
LVRCPVVVVFKMTFVRCMGVRPNRFHRTASVDRNLWTASTRIRTSSCEALNELQEATTTTDERQKDGDGSVSSGDHAPSAIIATQLAVTLIGVLIDGAISDGTLKSVASGAHELTGIWLVWLEESCAARFALVYIAETIVRNQMGVPVATMLSVLSMAARIAREP